MWRVQAFTTGVAMEHFPAVTLMFICPDQISQVAEVAGQQVYEETLKCFCNIVRKVLHENSIYECQELQGGFMVVTDQPYKAVQAALKLQLALMGAEWPESLPEALCRNTLADTNSPTAPKKR